MWHNDKHGIYSIKSGHWLARSSLAGPCSSDSSVASSWWRFLWQLYLPAKLLKPLFHAVWFCKSLETIRADRAFLAFPPVHGDLPILDFFLSYKSLNALAQFELLAVVWWRAWFRRNKLVHDEVSFSVADIVRVKLSAACSWDASLDPSVTEVVAIRFGMQLAVDHRLSLAVVESDAQTIINLIRAGISSHSEIRLLVDDIVKLKANHNFSNFVFSLRDSNRVAHNLAKMATIHAIDFVLVEDVPSGIRSLV
ncbi:hypothetical protein ACOSQ2_023264 [Xanthoceras sorbifolium]